jgi:iron-sulfur cluster assembly protein
MSTAQRPDITVSIKLTPEAVEQVTQFIANEDVSKDTAGLRVSVMPGGCSGFRYGLEIVERALDDDFVIEQDGLRLFVDPFSGQYLEGTEIGYVSTMQASGFTFTNPNASGGCGCGESFSA